VRDYNMIVGASGSKVGERWEHFNLIKFHLSTTVGHNLNLNLIQ